MGRLLLRIFLWFWLGSIALFIVLAGSFVMAQPDAFATWRAIGRTGMRYLGAHLADVAERQGVEAAAAAAANVDRERRLRVWLYASDGRLIAGESQVPGARDVIARALDKDEDDDAIVVGDAAVLARATTSESGTPYVVMWEAPRRLLSLAQLSPLRFTLRALALMLTSAVVCGLLTWQIAKPIGTLQAAARRVAEGDLDVRVGDDRDLQRGDALSDLAREFDAMAARIRELITSQQQLLADISHELRSPLARLQLALDLARRRVGDDIVEHQRIDQEVQRLNALIEQLLTLARLRAPFQPQFERLNFGDVVREVVQDASFEAQSSGRTVALEGDRDVQVRGNRALLRSALENVVRNALRYAPPNSSVSISMSAPQPGAIAVVTIRDRGPGVPADALTRLFDPFFRVDDARDRTNGGVGLGLAIAQQAMIAHHGSATALNHPEGGLLVRLELPVAI